MLGLRKDSEPENMSTEICKTKKQTGKNCKKKKKRLSQNYGTTTKCITYV